MEENNQAGLVFPGDRIAMEEEGLPYSNTYAENGEIYAAAIGKPKAFDGKIGIDSKHEVVGFERGMYVVGEITDDVKSVMFVKIDQLEMNGKVYVALKSGKIIIKDDSRGRGPPHMRNRRDHGMPEAPQYKVGDIVLATILSAEGDTYLLGLRDRECGVIHAKCEFCNTPLVPGDNPGVLYCTNCRHAERRKVSAMYNNLKDVITFITGKKEEMVQ